MKYFSMNLFALLFASLAFVGCNDDDDDDNNTTTPTEQTIAQIAAGDARFTTLVDALQRADLVNTLNNPGTFTVFAPTNDAFNDLLQELGYSDLDALETALGTDGLTNVLLYHVLGAEVPAAAVQTGFTNSLAERVSGSMQYLDIFISTASGVRLNDRATVSQADISASNGVIHVIDAVILPLNIVQLASLSPDHTTLVAVLGTADSDGDGTGGDLIPVLADAGSLFTVFAPTNMAFSNIQSTVDMLTIEQQATLLTYHVVSGANVVAAQVPDDAVPTVNGEDITLSTSGGVTVTDVGGGTANVTATDIQGTNGVIHVIDAVLIPTL